ncbi:MAG: AraC family transcriptional regulator [Spirulina sp. SIO3F2]|nr:AraC family transcriptional regulator [Spirulina sp. SIO3F2]
MAASLFASSLLIYTRMQLARSYGVDVETVLARAGVSEQKLQQPWTRVSLAENNALWRELVAVTNDPAIALKLGQYFQLPGLGVVGYVLMNTNTVAQGIQLFVRYKPLLTTAYTTEVEQTPAGLVFIERAAGAWQPERKYSFDFIASAIVTFHRNLGNRRVIPALRTIAFPFPEPDDLTPYREILGDREFAFDHDALRVEFAGDFSRVTLLNANPTLLRAFEAQVETLMQQYGDANDNNAPDSALPNRVRQKILQALRHEVPTVQTIAQQLAMSKRTLQLKLKGEKTTFKKLLDEVRRDLALEYVAAGQLNKSEIACLLGFAEVSVFSWTFKHWTGRCCSARLTPAPSAFQKQHSEHTVQ